jgi:peptidoglycan hydrolase-like protein with peptidoglycan-binding domain/curli biogenesis system outer membrane secretion channel CsgG
MKTTYKLTTSLFALAMVSGCVTTAPERAYEVRQPKSEVVRTFTSFSDSLRCMDELFLKYGVRDIVITSDGIPDATGKVSAGTKDMLISAMSRMSVRSNAFTFVDFDQRQEDIANLQQLVGFTDEFRVPSYYIRGAITQLDEGVIAESVGGSLALTNFSVGASKDQVVSVISTDMNVGKLVTRQIMPGISANNSIVVRRSGIGGDVGATIQKVGLSFNIAINNQEGMHQATRTLIDLSAIEISGKLTKVPYWRCLQIEQTNPQIDAEARGWFKDMSQKERVTFVQRALSASGDYRGRITGTLDNSTRSAIGRYQASHGLIANGRIDYDLYKSLISEDLAIGKRPAPAIEPMKAAATPLPLQVSMTTPKGRKPVYRVRESLAMTVTTSRDAYLYCYYSDANGTVARIFPNKFAPDSYVAANRPTAIPGKSGGFGIIFDKPGATEEVLCLASEREIGLRLPDSLKQKDLAPLPVASLDDVAAAYRKAGPGRTADARLPIKVAN